MAISDSSKIDFLWKKVTYGVTKTDSSSAKSGSNETISSPLPVYANLIWANAASIPGTPPTTTSSIVQVYTGASRVAAVNDTTSTLNITWKTNLIDWIPATFNANYSVKVYVGDPQTTGVQIFPDTANTEYVFDYNAGILHFPNSTPANIGNGIYVVGYRYVGAKGVSGGGVSSKTLVVADIPARDALTGLSAGDQVYVADASGIPTDAGAGEYAIYLWTGSAFVLIATEDSASSDAKTVALDLTAAGTGAILISDAGNGSRVISVSVDVSSAFDGTLEISVGTSGSASLLMSTSQNDLQSLGSYVVNPTVQLNTAGETALYVTYTGSATVGAAKLIVTYA